MIALVQRVKKAAVSLDETVVSRIGAGLLILLGVHREDGLKEMTWVARKCANLRIFADEKGLMNRSVMDVNGDILVVSQFTLYGNTEKGNRPSFVNSAPPEIAEPLYESFISELEAITRKNIETGVFGGMMDVELINDGPVTIFVEKEFPH